MFFKSRPVRWVALLIWKSPCQQGRHDRPCPGQGMGGVWRWRGERAGLSRRRAVQADMRGHAHPLPSGAPSSLTGSYRQGRRR